MQRWINRKSVLMCRWNLNCPPVYIYMVSLNAIIKSIPGTIQKTEKKMFLSNIEYFVIINSIYFASNICLLNKLILKCQYIARCKYGNHVSFSVLINKIVSQPWIRITFYLWISPTIKKKYLSYVAAVCFFVSKWIYLICI